MTGTDGHEFNPFEQGAEDAVELVWPTDLVRPDPPPLLVYLDLNHWIGLAKASTGHSDGAGYVDALEAARAVKESGKAIFPLSATHYMEISKILDSTRRADLASIMEELSDFATLASRAVIMRLELATALDNLVGSAPSPDQVPLLGRGVRHSVGVADGIHIVGPTGDASEEVRSQLGEAQFEQMMATMALVFEREVLAGPQDAAMEADLRARGWQPDAAVTIAEQRAQEERNQVGVIDTDQRWRRGRLRDIISAREILIDHFDALNEGLRARGVSPDDQVFSSRQAIRQFTRSMPSTEVSIEMKTQYHRNRSTTWNSNTIFDIDAMALSVPYCDAVVTEKNACATMRRVGIAERMHTALMRRPDELVTWLSAL